MPTCSTWRYLGTSDTTQILPIGHNRHVWRPCQAWVSTRGKWCSKCIDALAICPETEVRRQLIEHPFLSARVLMDLSTDSDYETKLRAQERLAELRTRRN